MTLAVGQTLGDYRIIGIIGSGGMGSVYKVQHLISDRVEAMKVVLPDLIDSPDLADRFIREIKVQARLSHPNITSLHNALRVDGQLLMVMEYIEGTTLYARLRRGRMEPRLTLDIMLQILSALGYAHAHGVVHRDIKPGNIMITSNGLVKIMDFGIARSLTDRQLTQAGAAIGSVYYMSPEQVQGTAVDARSDLYSVGILLYEVVTGTRPITGDSSWAVMNAHINQIPRSPGALNASLPNSLSLAILKAIQKNPADRFQSASEFADALRAVERLYAASLQGPASIDTQQVTLLFQGQQPGTPSDNRLKQGQSTRAAAPTEVKTPTPATPITPGASPNLKRFDAAELERLKRELAVYLGPMARIVTDRAAKKANNWQQLYDMLSAELPEGEERKKFLARRRR